MADYGSTDWYRHLVDPGGVFSEGGMFGRAKEQPGVLAGGGTYRGGQAAPLVRDPQTGLYYDQQTGISYVDEAGQQAVTNPNVAQQVAANFARSQSFLSNLAGVQAQQGALANNLRDVISGNAPSVAGMQAQQGMDTIAAQQMSQAAGVGGANGPLAQLLAARNTGAAQVAANNAGAIGRVAEQNAARGQLSDLLAGEAVTNASLGQGFASQASSGQAAQQGLSLQSQDQQNKKNAANTAALAALLA